MDVPWTIVCFSGVDWASHRQRPHFLMSALAERGADVLFVDNLGTRMPRLRDAGRVLRRLRGLARSSARRPPAILQSPARAGAGIRVDSPVVLPLQHVGAIRELGRRTLSRRIRARIGDRRPLVVWTYLPLPVIADAARELSADALVYDWSDDASEHVLSRSATQRRRIGTWEHEMAERADIVFAASAELLRSRGSPNPRTYLVPHGAPHRRAGSSNGSTIPQELSALPHPRIGFVGSITEWTDLDLVDRMAVERPAWSFVMVGPVKTRVKTLQRRANVLFTGERPHEEIPGYLSAFDVAIIPYRVTPATTAASPLKLREYLAADLPVVSVDVPEVRPFVPPVRLASDPDTFVEAIERALAEKRAPSRARARTELWGDRADEMVARIDEFLESR
ncbi:MAG: glycosyltransferase [Actinobacteria bacterium]|nr:glycosyltransferase [Actinomycetota bacterium]